ncbi:MAG: UvrD-helicase domain-containing protein, partial [Acidobacteria bacterium]|nr:UvrD-helicase domain-containing protein [Acidobacteriota bacterium]
MKDDSRERSRAVTEVQSSLIVEASAGTGKTSALVDRILHLVLDAGPDGTPLRMSEIAAITYTEKAAGEMKIRLRQRFEQEAESPGERGERARYALRDLEGAAISTFHSFAVSLLKERPVEAGLDPRFTTLDESQGDLLFQEIWEPWIYQAVLERHPALESALRAGLGLDRIREFAQVLRRHAYAVRKLQLPSPPKPEVLHGAIRRCLEDARALERLILNPGDKLATKLVMAMEWLGSPDPAVDFPTGFRRCGAAANWSGGSASVERVRALLDGAERLRRQARESPLQWLIDRLLRWLMDGFLAEWEAGKRRRALLDFDDQLQEARKLLVGSTAARRDFRRRFRAVLVDEFQDTDAVQLDLVLLLSSGGDSVDDPQRLTPEAGRLFIVGDPKQSIYRFRGADIESYLDAVARYGTGGNLRRLELTKNFRSVPSILRFVDRAFSGLMKASEDGRYQPDYLAFGGAVARTGEPDPPSVHILADRDAGGRVAGSGRDFLNAEAARVARLIREMHDGGGWMVEEAAAGGPGAVPARRKPRYGDIAVLMPVLTRAYVLEDALAEAGIPFVLEGGKFYYARSEVSSAIAALVAVANPNDTVALYAALRSIFFGLSDEDLLRAKVEGRRLDYRQEVPGSSPLSGPFRVLRELHERRHERAPSETYELLTANTGAREVLATRGLQSLANLAKLARTIRSLQSGRTFSQVVALLDAMDEEGAAEQESRLLEERSDSVRVLSVHKAKGLDFPIVIVAGMGRPRRGSREDFLADAHQTGTFGLKVKCLDQQIATPGWDVLEEGNKKREYAELVRLLYVALTRARDYLVISAHNHGDRAEAARFKGTRLEPLSGLLADPELESEGWVKFVDVAALDRAALPAPVRPKAPSQRALKKAYQDERAALEAALAKGAGALAPPEGEQDPGGARSRAVRMGVAFHEAMESLDFSGPAGIARIVSECGARHGLDAQAVAGLRRMIETTAGSELIER